VRLWTLQIYVDTRQFVSRLWTLWPPCVICTLYCVTCTMHTTNLFWSSCCVNSTVSIRSVKFKVANIVLPFFFKSNHNLDDKSPLVISFKFLAMFSSKANLSGNKVASNSESKCNNLIMQSMCPCGLLTFIPPPTLDLSKIKVLANKENKSLPKKTLKNYDVCCKCRDI